MDITPSYDDFVNSHETCFNSFDMKNDIIELQYGGNNAVQISINLINEDVTTQLLFGPNAESTWTAIDGNGFRCKSAEQMKSDGMAADSISEVSRLIKIQNGKIIQSACIGKFKRKENRKITNLTVHLQLIRILCDRNAFCYPKFKI